MFSNTFRIVFRIFFRVFQTVFRIDLNIFRGQFRSADMPPNQIHMFTLITRIVATKFSTQLSYARCRMRLGSCTALGREWAILRLLLEATDCWDATLASKKSQSQENRCVFKSHAKCKITKCKIASCTAEIAGKNRSRKSQKNRRDIAAIF